jgi:chorismate dehydratase
MKKVKISAVAYLNSKPLIYGLENTDIRNRIELSLDIPSVCADKLLNDRVDIGLVPVAALPFLKESYILTDYCIGAVGAVSSVMLYSQVPLHSLRSVYLDYQSRTSVALAKVLARDFWKISPRWLEASAGFENMITGATGAVVIGDRTFGLGNRFAYSYDLAGEWQEFTGLPFVFACWVANKKLPEDFLSAFSQAVEFGMQHKEKAITEWTLRNSYPVDVRQYLEKYISYGLDTDKRKAMGLFLSLIKASEPELISKSSLSDIW